MSKILSTSVVGFAGMYQWKVGDLGAHTSFLLVQRNILSAPVPVQLQLVGQGKPSRIPTRPHRTVGTKYHLEFSLVTWVCKADSITIQLND